MARMRRLLRKLIVAMSVSTLASSAAYAADLVIAMPNWPSGQVTANILKLGLKKEYGLDADVTEMGTLIAFNGLNSGEVDVHPEVWLPNLDNLVKKYVTDAGSVAVSPRGGEGGQGICATRAAADKAASRTSPTSTIPKRRRRWIPTGTGRANSGSARRPGRRRRSNASAPTATAMPRP
jgi:glycine betaine/proline transport system substrate-binding protein